MMPFTMFARLFRRFKPDPTAKWPVAPRWRPVMNWQTHAIGPMNFGALFHEAEQLGRPDLYESDDADPDYVTITYSLPGVLFGFENQQLEYMAFFFGPDPYLPKAPCLTFCRLEFGGGPFAGIMLTYQTTETFVSEALGKPMLRDVDDDETILFYRFGKDTFEFEFKPDGALKRLNVYPTDPAAGEVRSSKR